MPRVKEHAKDGALYITIVQRLRPYRVTLLRSKPGEKGYEAATVAAELDFCRVLSLRGGPSAAERPQRRAVPANVAATPACFPRSVSRSVAFEMPSAGQYSECGSHYCCLSVGIPSILLFFWGGDGPDGLPGYRPNGQLSSYYLFTIAYDCNQEQSKMQSHFTSSSEIGLGQNLGSSAIVENTWVGIPTGYRG
eukprot:1970149-Rhodomonas_salina.1